jgi:heme o synthase
MKDIVSTDARILVSPTERSGRREMLLARATDYVTLTKPRIAVMALLAVAAGYFLGSADTWRFEPFVFALAGTLLVAVGSSALNQFLETDTDRLMTRTADRPLPSGRLGRGEVLAFGLGTALAGVMVLALFVNGLTALLALGTLALYVLVYTPLKRESALCTLVGAIPGALPPVMGYAAAAGRLDALAGSLFVILFLWQFPHFLAIAWLYREDYSRAGLKMLPALAATPRVTGLLAAAYAAVLVPLSIYPASVGLAGRNYAGLALVLSLFYFAFALRFASRESAQRARELIWTSLIYLPALFLGLVWDHFRLLS